MPRAMSTGNTTAVLSDGYSFAMIIIETVETVAVEARQHCPLCLWTAIGASSPLGKGLAVNPFVGRRRQVVEG